MSIADQLADICPCPMLAFDENAEVIFSNRAWRKLAESDDGLLAALKTLYEPGETGQVTKELSRGQSWFKITANLSNPKERFLVLTEISELKRREEAALRMSRYDCLTRTYNRAAFRAYVDKLPRTTETALIFLDLDGFKLINDRYGHNVGDEVLKHTAARLQRLLKEGDIVARWGGDEFVICLPGTTASEAQEVRKRLLSAFNEAYVVDGIRLNIRASVGSVVVNLAEVSLEAALEQADAEMYRNKLPLKPRIPLRKGYSAEGLSRHS